MNENKPIRIGWGTCNITPDRPVMLSGQLYSRVSRYVHDPISATALVLDNGDTHAIMISCDMVGIMEGLAVRIRSALDGFEGIKGDHVSISATHTHNSSRFMGNARRSNLNKFLGEDICEPLEVPDNLLDGEEATEFFLSRLIPMAKDAWHNRAPGGIASAQDYAAIGFNRRPVYDMGEGREESRMYGSCADSNFLRFEGGSDHAIDMVYTFDMERNLTGVLVDVPSPSQVFELHYFISADYWKYARDSIRSRVGSNVHILSLCGAAGDQNPLDLVRLSKTNVEALREWNAQAGEVFRNFDMAEEAMDIGERIAEAVARGLRKARNRIQTRPDLRHKSFSMALPLRLVTEEDYRQSHATIEAFKARFSPENRMNSSDQVSMFNDMGVVQRWELQQETTTYSFQGNLTRVGNAVIITNPFELFVEYGQRIRARCKAPQVINVQLTNGVGGYVPTWAAIKGGSYSSKPASTNIDADGADQLVETYIHMIDEMF
jgi:hypothetical protein